MVSVFSTVALALAVTGKTWRHVCAPEDWNERDSDTVLSFAIIERATKAFDKIKESARFRQQSTCHQRAG
ncbi:hypothetical protein ACNKHS_14900 [Shigella flexneri]